MKHLRLTLGLLAVAATVAACGVDGEPLKPSATAAVTLTPDGLSTSGGVSVRKGPISVGLSL